MILRFYSFLVLHFRIASLPKLPDIYVSFAYLGCKVRLEQKNISENVIFVSTFRLRFPENLHRKQITFHFS